MSVKKKVIKFMNMYDNNVRIEDPCRICLATKNLFSAFDQRIHEDMVNIIHITTGVRITESDRITQNICRACSNFAIQAYRFRLKAEESDQRLKQSAAVFNYIPSPNVTILKEVRIPQGETNIKKIKPHPSYVKITIQYAHLQLPQDLQTNTNWDPYVLLESLDLEKWAHCLPRKHQRRKICKRSNSLHTRYEDDDSYEMSTTESDDTGDEAEYNTRSLRSTSLRSSDQASITSSMFSLDEYGVKKREIRKRKAKSMRPSYEDFIESDEDCLDQRLNLTKRPKLQRSTKDKHMSATKADELRTPVIKENINLLNLLNSPSSKIPTSTSVPISPFTSDTSYSFKRFFESIQVDIPSDAQANPSSTIAKQQTAISNQNPTNEISSMTSPYKSISNNITQVLSSTHEAKKTYTCKVCDLRNVSMKDLKAHQRETHTCCPFCTMSFDSVKAKNEHIKYYCSTQLESAMKSNVMLQLTRVEQIPEYREKYKDVFKSQLFKAKVEQNAYTSPKNLTHGLTLSLNSATNCIESPTLPLDSFKLPPYTDAHTPNITNSNQHSTVTSDLMPNNCDTNNDIIVINDDSPSPTIDNNKTIRIVDQPELNNYILEDSLEEVIKSLLRSRKNHTKDPSLPASPIVQGNTPKILIMENLFKELQNYKIPIDVQYSPTFSILYSSKVKQQNAVPKASWLGLTPFDIKDLPPRANRESNHAPYISTRNAPQNTTQPRQINSQHTQSSISPLQAVVPPAISPNNPAPNIVLNKHISSNVRSMAQSSVLPQTMETQLPTVGNIPCTSNNMQSPVLLSRGNDGEPYNTPTTLCNMTVPQLSPIASNGSHTLHYRKEAFLNNTQYSPFSSSQFVAKNPRPNTTTSHYVQVPSHMETANGIVPPNISPLHINGLSQTHTHGLEQSGVTTKKANALVSRPAAVIDTRRKSSVNMPTFICQYNSNCTAYPSIRVKNMDQLF